MPWQETPEKGAGELGREAVSPNCCSLGCPAAVHSASGEGISSHLEEIRMENTCVKNKSTKIAKQRKRKLCLLATSTTPSQTLVFFQKCSICRSSVMVALRSAQQLAGSPQEGLCPSGNEVTLQTCSSAGGREPSREMTLNSVPFLLFNVAS